MQIRPLAALFIIPATLLLTGQSECPTDDEVDNDGDGFTVTMGDCDDENSSTYPGAPEVSCDGVDNDCDGVGDDIVYVDAAADPDAATGTSWDDAFSTFRSVTGAACVWATTGTYYAWESNGSALTLEEGQAVYGGFGGWEATLSEREGLFSETILSGDFDRSGDNSVEDSYHVVRGSSAFILDGLTIRGGYALEDDATSEEGRGGGLYVPDGEDVILTDVIIEENYAATFGGGAYISGGDLLVTDCTFQGNSTFEQGWDGEGGGLYTTRSDITVSGATFEGNSASTLAGALYVSTGEASIFDSTFTNNSVTYRTAAWGGGAVVLYGSDGLIESSGFYGNTAAANGGAIRVDSLSSLYLRESIFEDNEAVSNGGALSAGLALDLHVSNTYFKGNSTDSWGGAIGVWDHNGEFLVENSSFILNDAYGKVGAIFANNMEAEDFKVYNSLFYLNAENGKSDIDTNGHTADIQHCAFDSDEFTDHFSEEPGSVDLGDSAFELNDDDGDGESHYFLSPSSPAVDAGSDDLANDSALGEGWWLGMTTRDDCVLDTGTVDIGAHYTPSPLCD